MKKKIKISIAFLPLLLIGCTEFFELQKPANIHTSNPQSIASQYAHIPVIAIEVDTDEFAFMYSNYWDDIEIYGSFIILRNNHSLLEIPHTRFSIKGLTSRAFDMKSLGIRFHDVIDNSNGEVFQTTSLLNHHSVETIEALRLRNSGSDFITALNATMIKDISYTRLAIHAGLDLDLMYSEQAVVFVNDQFYGLLNLRTESTARGIAALYQIAPSQVTLAKVVHENNVSRVEVQNGNYQRINNFLAAIADKNVGFLESQVDMENFIDYIIFNTFTANRDWPFNNVRFFAIDNSKFRFFLFDLDQSNISHLSRDHIELLQRGAKNAVSDLFFLFYEEEHFRESFYARYKELLSSGVFDPEVFRTITRDHYRNIESVMPLHIEKYGQPRAMAEWYRNIELLNLNYEIRFQNVSETILR